MSNDTKQQDVTPVAWGEPNPNEALDSAIEINALIGGELRQSFWWEQKGTVMAKAILDHTATIAKLEAERDLARSITECYSIEQATVRAELKSALKRATQAEASLAEMQRERDALETTIDELRLALAECQKREAGLREECDHLQISVSVMKREKDTIADFLINGDEQ